MTWSVLSLRFIQKVNRAFQTINMGDMVLGYDSERDVTPELRTCGGGGLLRCWYNYESKNSYLEVLASGEPEPIVSGVQGSCK